jgi:uncharacterized protein
MGSPVQIDLSTARRLVIAAQGLDGAWKLPQAKEGAARAVERLGYVQIDTIAVVERAHHHVLWCRRPDYKPPMLGELLERDRRVFEYWTHAAAYVPMRDYRYYLPMMRARAGRDWVRGILKDHAPLVRRVKARLRAEGPLPAGAFAPPPGTKRGPWWDWTPAKRVLETLLHTGDVMVAARRNFERLYDLTERVLPEDVDTTMPRRGDAARFIARQVLQTQGVATVQDVRWGHRREGVDAALREMVAAGEAVEVQIDGIAARHYATPDGLNGTAGKQRSSSGAAAPSRVHVLSPFDTFFRRDRMRRLFGFDYTIECYTPAAKRRYGYFTLPVLFGDSLVGRIDAKADRAAKTLILRHVALEPTFDAAAADGFLPAFADRLHAFAAFNGCDAVSVERTTPPRLRRALVRAVEERPDAIFW